MFKDITFDFTYKGLTINTDKENGLGCSTKILTKVHEHLYDMTARHGKTLQVRFDLRYPQDGSVTPDSEQLSDFSYNFQRKLRRKVGTGGHRVDPRLVTVSEHHGKSDTPHVHCVLLVNGNAIQNHMGILKQVEKTWGAAIASNDPGLVDYCDKHGKNGIMIDRNKEDFEQKLNEASHQASYLAKVRGKENRAKGAWQVRSTRLPRR